MRKRGDIKCLNSSSCSAVRASRGKKFHKRITVRIPPHIASLFPTADSPTDLSLLPLYHITHTRTVEPQDSAGKYSDIFQVLEGWDNLSLHFLPSPVSDTQYRGQSEWKRVSPYER